jgi:predicted metallo-beta-lactamase superfamily hydrolase
MKNFVQAITTEGLERYNALGMDFLINVDGLNVRVDPSPMLYRLCRDRDCELKRQRKLLKNSDVVLFSHNHSDHFGAEFMRNVYPEKKTVAFYQETCERCPGVPLDLHKVDCDVEIIKGYCNAVVPVYEYDRASFNDVEITLMPFRHSCYRGRYRGAVIAAHIQNGEKDVFFTSDVSGPEHDGACYEIINANPSCLILDGPFNNVLASTKRGNETKHAARELVKSYRNFKNILAMTKDLRSVIVGHHFVRGFRFPKNGLTDVPDVLKRRVAENRDYDEKLRRDILAEYEKLDMIVYQIEGIIEERGIFCCTPAMLPGEVLVL